MAERSSPTDDIREMSDSELVTAVEAAQRELFLLRMRHATRQLEKSHTLRRARRQIARLKTIQSERRLGMTRG